MNGRDVFDLMRISLTDPRAGMRAVLALNLPPAAGFAALVLMAVASALMLHLTVALMPPEDRAVAAALFGSPFVSAVLQFAVLAASVVLVHVLGRGAGGIGRFDQAVLMMAWLQALMLALQAVQILLMLALPPVAGLVGIAALGLFFWLLTGFVTELHGFSRPGRVFGAILATLFLMGLALTTVLGAILGPEALPNV